MATVTRNEEGSLVKDDGPRIQSLTSRNTYQPRPLTIAEIKTLLTTTCGALGQIEAVRRFAQPHEHGIGPELGAERQFVDALLHQARGAQKTAAIRKLPAAPPADPTRGVTARRLTDGEKRERFTVGDLHWLDRLPDHPRDITPDDARRAAALAVNAVPGSSDQALAQAVLDKIRSHYALLQADYQVTKHNASSVGVTLPRTAETVVANAMRREQPDTAGLTERELLSRARQLIADIRGEQEQAHEDKADQLRQAARKLRFGL